MRLDAAADGDVSMLGEADALMPEALQDEMQASSASSNASSISHGFRFVHPVPHPQRYQDDGMSPLCHSQKGCLWILLERAKCIKNWVY